MKYIIKVVHTTEQIYQTREIIMKPIDKLGKKEFERPVVVNYDEYFYMPSNISYEKYLAFDIEELALKLNQLISSHNELIKIINKLKE